MWVYATLCCRRCPRRDGGAAANFINKRERASERAGGRMTCDGMEDDKVPHGIPSE